MRFFAHNKMYKESSNPKTQKERKRNENETRKEMKETQKKEGGKKERETTGEL